MNKKKVLIIHATAGSGHTKASQAIYKAFNQIKGDLEVKIINSLDYTNTFFKWSYPNIYVFLVNRIPLIWGFFYYFLDNSFFYPLVSWIRHLTNWINSKSLARFIEQYQPDLIINTHFLAPDVITMAGRGRIKAHLISVITDYRAHSFWIAKGVDTYVVPYEETKTDLIKRAVSPDKIKVLGMPIDPIFSKSVDKDEIRNRFNIKAGRFTVLVGSGGFGIGPIESLVKEIMELDIPIQLLVVCGKNELLFSAIKKLAEKAPFPVAAFGFIDNMHELMSISDIIVTKSGGMVCAEALAKELPIVGIFPIPGQESRNLNLLLRKKIAFKLKKTSSIKSLLTGLYNNKDQLDKLKKRVLDARRPFASLDIVKMALEILEKDK